jgi:hypothetical protein
VTVRYGTVIAGLFAELLFTATAGQGTRLVHGLTKCSARAWRGRAEPPLRLAMGRSQEGAGGRE